MQSHLRMERHSRETRSHVIGKLTGQILSYLVDWPLQLDDETYSGSNIFGKGGIPENPPPGKGDDGSPVSPLEGLVFTNL
jgi:hypothetical protein